MSTAVKEPETVRLTSLKFTAPLEFKSLDVEAKEGEAPKRPTFSILAYTGAPVEVGFGMPVILELSGFKADRDRMPILRDHDAGRIVGMSTTAVVDEQGARLEGTVTGDSGDAAEVVSQAKNGFEWQASIGASIVRREFLKAGEKAVVNGREITGPMIIARESRWRETSFVALGADHQTSASVAASAAADSARGLTLAALHNRRQS